MVGFQTAMLSLLLLFALNLQSSSQGIAASGQEQEVRQVQSGNLPPQTNPPADATQPQSSAPPSSAQAAPVYRVPSDYAYFTALKTEMPPYPEDALKKGIEGDVILAAKYSPEGNVEAMQRVLGDPELAKAAMNAVSNWKFLPIKEKGKKSEGLTYIGFHFMAAGKSVLNSFPFGIWKEMPLSVTNVADSGDGKHYRILSGVAARNKLSGKNPIYPQSARSSRVQGEVQLRAIVDKQGHISFLEIVKAPSKDLGLASIEAVKTWEYKPYTLNGEPVDIETVINVNYTLSP